MFNSSACDCGNNRFYVSQTSHQTIIVDPDNSFQEVADDGYSDTPEGPWLCTDCGKSWKSLDDLPDDSSRIHGLSKY